MRVRAITDAILREPWLWAIIILAFSLRIAGIGYGLPLHVVADEYPFTYGALSMLQSHAFIPSLQPELFRSILPYPPYLSYVLLVPFAAILGFKYFLFHGSMELFRASVISDLSPFFLVARSLNVLMGVLSVYLTYRIAERLFASRRAALFAAFFLATSLMHIALSMVGRNWMPMSLVYLAVLYALTQPSWSIVRRYTVAFVIAGFGMGISAFSAFSLLLAGLYYLLFDLRFFRQILGDALRFSGGALLFCVLAVIPTLLWNSGNAFLGAVTFLSDKSALGALMSPWTMLQHISLSEPVLVASCLMGIGLLLARRERTGVFLIVWIFLYSLIFYALFRIESRFILPLMPLISLGAGYAFDRAWSSRSAMVLCVLLCVSLVVSVRLSYLAWQGDTRTAAREWVQNNLGPDDKLLVFSSAMHIPTTKAAYEELHAIDVGAVRTINEIDAVIVSHTRPRVLNNLTSVTDQMFIADLPSYANRHGYRFLLVEPRSFQGLPKTASSIQVLISEGAVAKSFLGLNDPMSIYNSEFIQPLPILFSKKSLGPDILIYRLSYDESS